MAPRHSNEEIEMLLRRGLVPKEATTSQGTVVFRTSDSEVYRRLADGSIRRTQPKVNGKQARKQRALTRRKVQHVIQAG